MKNRELLYQVLDYLEYEKADPDNYIEGDESKMIKLRHVDELIYKVKKALD